MSDPLTQTLLQFGPAGLIGLMWLIERRVSGTRERQLDETHRMLMTQQRELDVLIDVIRDNTRAIQALESGQARLITWLEHPTTSSRRPSQAAS